MTIAIRRSKDPFGWMGNMSPFKIEYKGKEYRTAEALFQCLRFDNEEVQEAIRAEKSPMTAKFKAKKHVDLMIVEQLSEQDLDNMRLCLRLKLEQHSQLKQELADTKDEFIVEDCTKRQRGSGLFWGAALIDDEWKGDNWLGKLWMEIRNDSLTIQEHI